MHQYHHENCETNVQDLAVGAARHQRLLVPEQVEDGDAVGGGPPPPHGDGYDQPRRGRHLGGGGALGLHYGGEGHRHHNHSPRSS